jgi:hypothetical protein
MKHCYILLTLLSFSVVSLQAQSENWKLRTNKNGVKVYTQKVTGSSFEAFRGVMELECSIGSAVAVIRDIAAYPQWVYMTDTAMVLKTEGNVNYLYSVSKAPWPVSKRDVVYMSRMVQNPDTKEVIITLASVPDYFPLKPGMVRIPEASGFWQFTPMRSGNITVTYQVHSETGGSIPSWLSNMAATEAPYNILQNLRERVKLEKYRDAKPEGIIP